MQGNDSKKPSAYLKEREKTVLRRLIAIIEEKPEKRMPKYLHTYRVISQNQLIHFLWQIMVALGYNKKDDVTQPFFMQKICKATVDHQILEIKKAICNQSNKVLTSMSC